MPFKRAPNIEKMTANQNIRGLIKALTYEQDPRVPEAATQALIELGKTARKNNDPRFFKIFDTYKKKPGKEWRLKLERISNSIFPEFASGPRSEMVDRMLHPEDYKKTKGQFTTRPLHIPKKDD